MTDAPPSLEPCGCGGRPAMHSAEIVRGEGVLTYARACNHCGLRTPHFRSLAEADSAWSLAMRAPAAEAQRRIYEKAEMWCDAQTARADLHLSALAAFEAARRHFANLKKGVSDD